MPNSPNYPATTIAALSSASLSLLGSLFLIITFSKYRDFESSSRRLVVFLSTADICQALFFLLIPLGDANQTACSYFAMFGIWAALSSFCWTILIAHFIWHTVAFPSESRTR
jgi:hypothetical protein